MSGEIKNNPEVNNTDLHNRLDALPNVERFDLEKRIRIPEPGRDFFENQLKEFRDQMGVIGEKLEGKNLLEIVEEPFESLIDNWKDLSLDKLVLASGCLSSCKMACAGAIIGSDISDVKGNIGERLKDSLTSFFSAPENVNKYIREYGIGPDRLKECAGEVAELSLELGKAIFYIVNQINLGTIQILDNACRAVFSMGLYAFGKSEAAKEVMSESNVEKFREYLDKVVQPNELEKKIGDIAFKANGVLGELALAIVGAMGLAGVTPVAATGIIMSATVLGFDEAGKSLENNIEKSGEYGKKEFLSALTTVGLTITLERIIPCISNLSKEANLYRIADKVSDYVGNKYELGAKLTKAIIRSIQGGAGMAVFKGADSIQKYTDSCLGITDTFDGKRELLYYATSVLGMAVCMGGVSFAADTVVRSDLFKKMAQKLNNDFTLHESKYDIIYKRTELAKEYGNEIIELGVVPESFIKNKITPDAYYREIPETVEQKRTEFNRSKMKIIKEWEQNTGQEWPRYKEDVVIELKDGTKKVIRKAGQLYDAHHINPLSWGGENSWDNITPLQADVHYDHRGVHAVDSAFDQLTKYMEGLL